uniref:Methyltransferase FkbM domain-containing protein n=1 Tax=Panagrolaimus sp. ES5 TaxID=591445 RepID=A0AC34FCJ7_9BILA
MYFIVKRCSGKLFKALNIRELPNRNENKYFIIPNSFETESCNVITLGIGRDVGAEEKLLQIMPQCKFLGVDSGEVNRKLYQEKLNGKFIKGLVGAENGTYKASIMDKRAQYSEKVLPHYSFKYLTSQFLNESLIDLLLMDIEGDEFALMEDMIDFSAVIMAIMVIIMMIIMIITMIIMIITTTIIITDTDKFK